MRERHPLGPSGERYSNAHSLENFLKLSHIQRRELVWSALFAIAEAAAARLHLRGRGILPPGLLRCDGANP